MMITKISSMQTNRQKFASLETNQKSNVTFCNYIQNSKLPMSYQPIFTGCGKYLAKEIIARTDDPTKWQFLFSSSSPKARKTIGRLIIADNWSGKAENAKKLFESACHNWPKGQKTDFLIGCGGLVKFDWPQNLPAGKEFETLTKRAQETVEQILDTKLMKKLNKITDYLSFGVDSCSSPMGSFNSPHAELVCFVDLKNRTFHWTGKSYPFSEQVKGLVKAPIESHFVQLGGKNVMLLGCHDLSIFSPRSTKNATTEFRVGIQKEMKKLARKHQPTIVLQHPHTTDTPNTWKMAWQFLSQDFPCVENFASAGKFYNADGPVRAKSINDVLTATRKGKTSDLILSV